jgi:hypothetical protein
MYRAPQDGHAIGMVPSTYSCSYPLVLVLVPTSTRAYLLVLVPPTSYYVVLVPTRTRTYSYLLDKYSYSRFSSDTPAITTLGVHGAPLHYSTYDR